VTPRPVALQPPVRPGPEPVRLPGQAPLEAPPRAPSNALLPPQLAAEATPEAELRQVRAAAAPDSAARRPYPQPRSARAALQVIAALAALAARGDAAGLQACAAALAPAALADVVIATLVHLPPRAAWAAAGAPAPAGTDALAGLMQARARPGARPRAALRLARPRLTGRARAGAGGPRRGRRGRAARGCPGGAGRARGRSGRWGCAAAAAAECPRAGARRPGSAGPQQPARARERAPRVQGALPAAAPKAAPPPPPPPLAPLALDAAAEAALRVGAVRRILHADRTPAQHFRAAVLARLATSCAPAPRVPSRAQRPRVRRLTRRRAARRTATASRTSCCSTCWPTSTRAAGWRWRCAGCTRCSPRTRAPRRRCRARGASARRPAARAWRARATRLCCWRCWRACGAPRRGVHAGTERVCGALPYCDTCRGVRAARRAPRRWRPCGLAVRRRSHAAGRAWTRGRAPAAGARPPRRSPRRRARREQLPPSDRTIARLLLEAPALPHAGAAAFLADLAASGGEWATLALTAARGVAVARPPDRAMALGVVLAAAVGADADLRCAPARPAAPLAAPRSRRRPPGAPRRTKAVRLVANKLFTEPAMADDVERFAAAALRELADAARPAAGAAVPASNGVKLEAGAAPGAGAGEDVGDGAGDGAAPGAGAAADEQRARQRCQLFCALCTKRHALLRTLFEVYGQVAPLACARAHVPPAGRRPARLRPRGAQAGDAARRAVRADAPGLARTVGAGAAALPALLADLPPGSEPLALQMLYVLTGAPAARARGGAVAAPPLTRAARAAERPPAAPEAGPPAAAPWPPAPLVRACLDAADARGDARFLPPALPGLPPREALALLPRLLGLAPAGFRAALQRMLMPLGSGAARGCCAVSQCRAAARPGPRPAAGPPARRPAAAAAGRRADGHPRRGPRARAAQAADRRAERVRAAARPVPAGGARGRAAAARHPARCPARGPVACSCAAAAHGAEPRRARRTPLPVLFMRFVIQVRGAARRRAARARARRRSPPARPRRCWRPRRGCAATCWSCSATWCRAGSGPSPTSGAGGSWPPRRPRPTPSRPCCRRAGV